ncbi:MAG: glycosyltransferase family 4 protein [Candidatus Cloacimonetes bacterium]|nr:glycosyltransferase family 4 protein [Candidatus Cloacimonadota bacterium]
MNKKVLIIADEPNWAQDKNAKDIIKYNCSNIKFDLTYIDDFIKNWKNLIQEYDLIHTMYMGIFFSLLKNNIPIEKVTTGIKSYHRWDFKKESIPPGYNVNPPKKIVKLLKQAVLVNTHCWKLWYNFVPYFPIVHTKYTCNFTYFYPEKKTKNNKLVIGWSGSLKNHANKRGFYDLIKPACDSFPEVVLKIQSKEENPITDDNLMRFFYNSLDVYICASRSEGTPRPVIEAAACGIPILSTDVGLVPDLVDDGISGRIVERNLESLKKGIKFFVDKRDRIPQMGAHIRRKMEIEYDWHKLVIQWTDFFEYAIKLVELKKNKIIK